MLNKTVHKAIVKLIDQYKTRTKFNYITNCPLCEKFNCAQCPNVAFNKKVSVLFKFKMGCLMRREIYPNLDFKDRVCADNLADFWTQVLELIPDDNKKYYLNKETSKKILEIAETF